VLWTNNVSCINNALEICEYLFAIIGSIDYSKIVNPECANYLKVPIKTLNVNINLDVEQTPVLKINVGPEHMSYTTFLKEGYAKLRNEPSEIQNSTITAKDVLVAPNNDDDVRIALKILNVFANIC